MDSGSDYIVERYVIDEYGACKRKHDRAPQVFHHVFAALRFAVWCATTECVKARVVERCNGFNRVFLAVSPGGSLAFDPSSAFKPA
jgi:hypothetical protein